MNFTPINQFNQNRKIDITTKFISTALFCMYRWFITVASRILPIILLDTFEESQEKPLKDMDIRHCINPFHILFLSFWD